MLEASQLFVLSPRGDKLLWKDFRQQIKQHTDEIFFRKYRLWDDGTESGKNMGVADCPPIFVHDNVYYAHIVKNQMIFVVTTVEKHARISLLIEALNRFARILKDFIGVLNEETLKQNILLAYEVLEEFIQFGFIREPATERLIPYIHSDPVTPPKPEQNTLQYLKNAIPYNPFSDKKDAIDQQASVLVAKNQQKNELFIDLIERINVVFNAKGNVQSSDIVGSIVLKSFLMGSPVVTLGLNEDITLQDDGSSLRYGGKTIDAFNLHECVDAGIFEASTAFSFRPPLGEFILMNYSISTTYNVPFRIFPTIKQIGSHRMQITLIIHSDYTADITAEDVRVRLHLPMDTTTAIAELGKEGTGETTEFTSSDPMMTWHIPKFIGKQDCRAIIRFSTIEPVSDGTMYDIGPISMTFEIPNLNLSSLQVRNLRIQERTKSYSPTRWVRHITKGVNYIYRMT